MTGSVRNCCAQCPWFTCRNETVGERVCGVSEAGDGQQRDGGQGMKVNKRSGWAAAVAALVCLCLAGCGNNVKGHTYAAARRIGDDRIRIGRDCERDDGSDPSDLHVYAEWQAGEPDVRRADRDSDGRRWDVGWAAGNGGAFDEGEVRQNAVESVGLTESASRRPGGQ